MAAPGAEVLSAAPARRIVFSDDFSGDLAKWGPNEWAIADGRFTARGVYRNKETDLTLDSSALSEYVGKRARKGKVLAIKVKHPTLCAA